MGGLGEGTLLAVPAGFLIGAWAGLSGYSGWPLVVPVLLVVAGRPLHESLIVSMWVDWSSAVSSSIAYLKRGDADRGVAIHWALVCLPFLLLGVVLSFTLLRRHEGLLRGGAGPIALVLGAALLVRAVRRRGREGATDADPTSPGSRRSEALLRGGMGLNATGMGLLGMGGGFNAGILFVLLRGAPTRRGVATGLLFTALLLPVALLAYAVMLGGLIEFWPAALALGGASALGAGGAAWQSGRIASDRLAYVVAGCVLFVGVLATVQRWALG